MHENKIKTYFGFAIKSGKIIYGFENVYKTNKKIKLIVACKSTTAKNLEKLKRLSEEKGVPLIQTTNDYLHEWLFRDTVKVIAFTDENLAKAVLDNVNDKQYIIIKRGNSIG